MLSFLDTSTVNVDIDALRSCTNDCPLIDSARMFLWLYSYFITPMHVLENKLNSGFGTLIANFLPLMDRNEITEFEGLPGKSFIDVDLNYGPWLSQIPYEMIPFEDSLNNEFKYFSLNSTADKFYELVQVSQSHFSRHGLIWP